MGSGAKGLEGHDIAFQETSCGHFLTYRKPTVNPEP